MEPTCWGVTDAELKSLRRQLLAVAAPVSRCSLRAKLAIVGDPVWAEAVGPASTWAAEVWRMAAGDRPCAGAKTMTLAWMAASARSDGWKRSAGPARRCILSLQRIGWSMSGPFTMLDDRGATIDLLRTSPAMVTHLLREANQRWHERQLGDLLWPGEGRRCCTDVVRAATSSGARAHDRAGKGIIKCIACDGFWGMHRRREKGYDVADLRPLCQSAPDTLSHRLWHCPCVEGARVAAVGQDNVDMMRRLQEDDPLATRGLFKHPVGKAPGPATGGAIIAVSYGRDRWGQPLEEEIDWRGLALAGDAYPDGAFYPHPIKDLGRAGWSLVVTDGTGNKTVELRGPVPAPLPQSPQAAEYLAVTAAASVFTPGLALFPDCAHVVRDLQQALL